MNGKDSTGLTIKQLKFAQAFLETGNSAEAYRRAYDCSNSSEKTILRRGQEISTKGVVKAYIDEQRALIVKASNIKVSDLIEELEQAREIAISSNIPGAAINATMGKAKLLGYDKPKDSNSETDQPESIEIKFEEFDGRKKEKDD